MDTAVTVLFAPFNFPPPTIRMYLGSAITSRLLVYWLGDGVETLVQGVPGAASPRLMKTSDLLPQLITMVPFGPPAGVQTT